MGILILEGGKQAEVKQKKKIKRSRQHITITIVMKLLLPKFPYDLTQQVKKDMRLQYIKEGDQVNIFAKLLKDNLYEAMRIARRAFYGRVESREDVGNIIQLISNHISLWFLSKSSQIRSFYLEKFLSLQKSKSSHDCSRSFYLFWYPCNSSIWLLEVVQQQEIGICTSKNRAQEGSILYEKIV